MVVGTLGPKRLDMRFVALETIKIAHRFASLLTFRPAAFPPVSLFTEPNDSNAAQRHLQVTTSPLISWPRLQAKPCKRNHRWCQPACHRQKAFSATYPHRPDCEQYVAVPSLGPPNKLVKCRTSGRGRPALWLSILAAKPWHTPVGNWSMGRIGVALATTPFPAPLAGWRVQIVLVYLVVPWWYSSIMLCLAGVSAHIRQESRAPNAPIFM